MARFEERGVGGTFRAGLKTGPPPEKDQNI